MRQARCDSNLAKETLGSDRNADVLPQNLDRDLTLMLALFGEVNYRHAPAPEDALYRVAVAESAGEAVRHEGRIYSQPVWRAPSALLDHHVLLEPRDFRLVHVLPDFAAELLDGCVRAILLELVTHSRSNARNEENLITRRRIEVDWNPDLRVNRVTLLFVQALCEDLVDVHHALVRTCCDQSGRRRGGYS